MAQAKPFYSLWNCVQLDYLDSNQITLIQTRAAYDVVWLSTFQHQIGEARVYERQEEADTHLYSVKWMSNQNTSSTYGRHTEFKWSYTLESL